MFKPPTDAKQLMLDFYSVVALRLVGVTPGEASMATAPSPVDLTYYTTDVAIAENAMRARSALIAAEHARLLRDLPLINAAEIGHVKDSVCTPQHGSVSSSYVKALGKIGADWYAAFQSAKSNSSSNGVVLPTEFAPHCSYVKRYVAAMYASKKTGIPLVDVAVATFDKKYFKWGGAYGGPKWLRIAECWRDLLDAKTENEVIHAIDIINALEHNTCTLFNKCQHYGGHGWVSEVLDLKFSAQYPFSYAGYCSKEVQPYLLAFRKAVMARVGSLRSLNTSLYVKDADGQWVKRAPTITESAVAALSTNIELVKKFSVGSMFTLVYNGKSCQFKVKSVLNAVDGSRQFVASAQGWSLSKGDGISVTRFAFDSLELALSPKPLVAGGTALEIFSGPSEADDDDMLTPYAPQNPAVTKAVQLLHQQLLKLSAKLEDVNVGSVHTSGAFYRVRIHKNGETNCRFYFKEVDGKIATYFTHTNEAVDKESKMLQLGVPLPVSVFTVENAIKLASAMLMSSLDTWGGEVLHGTKYTLMALELAKLPVSDAEDKPLAKAKTVKAKGKSTSIMTALSEHFSGAAASLPESLKTAKVSEDAQLHGTAFTHNVLLTSHKKNVVVHGGFYKLYLGFGSEG